MGNMKDKNKDKDNGPRINIRVPQAEKDSLQEVSALMGVTSTTIVREAVKQKVNELHRKLLESGLPVTI